MKRILVIATLDWPQITRVCLALADAGFKVRALAPDHHRLHKMRTIDVGLLHRTRTAALHSISRAVERFLPDIVIPGDERAIDYMHSLYMGATRGHGRRAHLLAELIETSLGSPSSFVFARQTSCFVQLARDEGLLVPATAVVNNVRQLRARVTGARFPLVLKRDERAGGQGVRIVTNAKEAERNFIELRLAGGRIMALMQTLDSRDASYLARFFKPNPAIILQEYIEGRPANRAVVCRQGRVLAGLSVEALQTRGPTHPASVVQIIDSPDMTEAAAFLVQRLGLSGFVGFDFMIGAGSGQAYLLEMNGRPTPICHIALDSPTDMISALAQPFAITRKVPNVDSPIVALFPQEVWRDPKSGYLRAAYHDVPPHAAEFVTFYADPVASEPESRLRQVASSFVRGRRVGSKVRAFREISP
jgi:glutathione synthase/RimK-type ligase-like ATP-grasp enzyme